MTRIVLKYLFITCVFLIFSGVSQASGNKQTFWTIDNLIEDKVRPYVIGHRGYGENLGEDPTLPIENTLKSVRRAFDAGVSIVEVDVSVTADGRAVAIHDDFLADGTCINTLTFDELREHLSYVPTLESVLRVAKKYARKSPHISGLINIEVKTPAPMCDPYDVTEAPLVASVLYAVEKTKMQEQVVIEAFSPAIMQMFANEALNLKRNFSINALQLLSAEEIEAETGLPVTLIDKDAGFGLQWAEIGPYFRLPGYESLEQYIGVALMLGSQFVTLDRLMLLQMEMLQSGLGAMVVGQLHELGFTVTVYTVDTAPEWEMFAAMGLDGIYTNNIPMGLAYEAAQTGSVLDLDKFSSKKHKKIKKKLKKDWYSH